MLSYTSESLHPLHNRCTRSPHSTDITHSYSPFLRFHSRRTFDLRELKTLLIRYNTAENQYHLCLRCLPLNAGSQEGSGGGTGGGGTGDAAKPKSFRKEYIATFLHLPMLVGASASQLADKEPIVQEWKLKRITDQCQIQLDGNERTYKLTNHFGYGFASKYRGPPSASEVGLILFLQFPRYSN